LVEKIEKNRIGGMEAVGERQEMRETNDLR